MANYEYFNSEYFPHDNLQRASDLFPTIQFDLSSNSPFHIDSPRSPINDFNNSHLTPFSNQLRSPAPAENVGHIYYMPAKPPKGVSTSTPASVAFTPSHQQRYTKDKRAASPTPSRKQEEEYQQHQEAQEERVPDNEIDNETDYGTDAGETDYGTDAGESDDEYEEHRNPRGEDIIKMASADAASSSPTSNVKKSKGKGRGPQKAYTSKRKFKHEGGFREFTKEHTKNIPLSTDEVNYLQEKYMNDYTRRKLEAQYSGIPFGKKANAKKSYIPFPDYLMTVHNLTKEDILFKKLAIVFSRVEARTNQDKYRDRQRMKAETATSDPPLPVDDAPSSTSASTSSSVTLRKTRALPCPATEFPHPPSSSFFPAASSSRKGTKRFRDEYEATSSSDNVTDNTASQPDPNLAHLMGELEAEREASAQLRSQLENIKSQLKVTESQCGLLKTSLETETKLLELERNNTARLILQLSEKDKAIKGYADEKRKWKNKANETK